ncbi:DUF5949 family protein [Streptomyces sp. MZ04]|uniref:DUF5949 family protein n=1 Tax=Streptomyces sp. MZ04 TaxID=2559236 RepID=UPI00107EB7AB|nr:DUF5949 family protein [Streptomyces sp. MZ04]TGA93795.1 hypothetical protein E2651_35475 [Streptomyces sp. MZ04]
MTSTSSESRTFQPADLGTLTVVAWSGEHPEDQEDMPFLLAYSLGDGAGGPEAASEAVGALLRNTGLPIGGPVVESSRNPSLPVTLLVEGGGVVLNMPHLNAQCAVPPEWLDAIEDRGHAYFMFTTRPWPQATPGTPIAEEDLAAFAGDEETMTHSAHCLLTARSLRG